MNAIDTFAPEIVRSLSAVSVKAVLLLLAAWIISLLMRRTSGASRHLVWTLAVAGVLAFPLLERMMPQWHVAVLPTRAVLTTTPTKSDMAPQARALTSPWQINIPGLPAPVLFLQLN